MSALDPAWDEEAEEAVTYSLATDGDGGLPFSLVRDGEGAEKTDGEGAGKTDGEGAAAKGDTGLFDTENNEGRSLRLGFLPCFTLNFVFAFFREVADEGEAFASSFSSSLSNSSSSSSLSSSPRSCQLPLGLMWSLSPLFSLSLAALPLSTLTVGIAPLLSRVATSKLPISTLSLSPLSSSSPSSPWMGSEVGGSTGESSPWMNFHLVVVVVFAVRILFIVRLDLLPPRLMGVVVAVRLRELRIAETVFGVRGKPALRRLRGRCWR